MKLFLKTKDHSVSKEEFSLLYNKELDMLVTTPEPDNLEKYYESDAYISHTDAETTLVDRVYQSVKKYSLNKKVKLIVGLTNSQKTLLDVGAGTGDFLNTAKSKGWQIDGVEPSSIARKKAAAKGLNLNENLKSLTNKKYNIITLWHVLEHLPNLEEQLIALKSLLTEDGHIIVAVPNYRSLDARHYKEYWAAYDVPRHLWHFSQTAIQRIFAQHKMSIIKTKPMLFDSFYVSLLSEKYKTGKQNYLRSFWIGLRSNLAAMLSKEHSSIIYIIKND